MNTADDMNQDEDIEDLDEDSPDDDEIDDPFDLNYADSPLTPLDEIVRKRMESSD
jgi:hypothetical protein